jgi:dTDP-4-dehydrorhamnose reductase
MVKPRLPDCIAKLLPLDVIWYISTFIPHMEKRQPTYTYGNLTLQKDLKRLQNRKLKGKNEMYKEDHKCILELAKLEGELKGKKVITIRTSVIGHEVSSKNGLLEWFLNQKKSCLGFANCYFSGLTSYEIYNFISRYLLKSEISGLIHLSSSPISKFKLLKIISSVYKKKILIKKDLKLKINRVLNSNLIKKKLLYKAPSWTRMIKEMYKNKK